MQILLMQIQKHSVLDWASGSLYSSHIVELSDKNHPN